MITQLHVHWIHLEENSIEYKSNSGVLKCVIHLKTPLYNSRLIKKQNYKQLEFFGFNVITCMHVLDWMYI